MRHYGGDLAADLARLDGENFVPELQRIGKLIGYGRAQQILQVLWAKHLSANGFATVGALLPEPLEAQPVAVPDELSCDDIERLCMALSWEGYSTPEGLENCAARWPKLVRDLIRAVLSRKARAQLSSAPKPEGGE